MSRGGGVELGDHPTFDTESKNLLKSKIPYV